MNYVYILQSLSNPDHFCTGLCADVARRLAAHNAGNRRTPPSISRGSC
jgi:predicted GIY-YIG superfamily endonuclease